MTIQDYINDIAVDKKNNFLQLLETVRKNIPKEFEETISYKMIGFVVPKSIYPDGYHCDTSLPLPFLGLAAQKNFISIYHMGIYADDDLLKWFVAEFPKHSKLKLDMGKSCIRFKKTDQMPLVLIGELMTKMSVTNWIALYESKYKKT